MHRRNLDDDNFVGSSNSRFKPSLVEKRSLVQMPM